MQPLAVKQRQTKYCDAIEAALAKLGHTTNSELLRILRISYPDISATTVHRATARLADRGTIGIAPSSSDGSMRYDTNVAPHDHFMCSQCSEIRDTDVIDQVKPILEQSIAECSIEGRLTISGICKKCRENRS